MHFQYFLPIFLNCAICNPIVFKICFAFQFAESLLTLNILPHSLTKYSKSASICLFVAWSGVLVCLLLTVGPRHLLVNWANLEVSELNASSRSNNSKGGGNNSLNVGGNTYKCNVIFVFQFVQYCMEINNVIYERYYCKFYILLLEVLVTAFPIVVWWVLTVHVWFRVNCIIQSLQELQINCLISI